MRHSELHGYGGESSHVLSNLIKQGDVSDPLVGEPNWESLKSDSVDARNFPVPLFIQSFNLAKIKLTISVRFSSSSEGGGGSRRADVLVLMFIFVLRTMPGHLRLYITFATSPFATLTSCLS